MKKIYLAVSGVLTVASSLTAQTACSTGRYANDVYTNITTTSAIPYGSNTTWSGSAQTLTLDFHEPAGDTCTARPLIIWAHGGSFVGGASTDPDVDTLSNRFARKGFACASINYRIGFYPFDSAHAVIAVVRAVQDMKAAIRFFYKDRKNSNTYKIDTNNIFIGGSSAGAIAALHVAYLDRPCEIQPYVNSTTLNSMGGLSGNSGNPGYSERVKGVINLCGALAIYGWLEAGNLPFCSMHGTIDATVKYNRGIVNPGTPLMYLDGSRMLYAQAVALGVQNKFYTWLGADHVPYVQGGTAATQAAYMDTTVNFVRDYLIDRLGCTNPALQPPNAPAQTATLYPYTPCLVDIRTISNSLALEIYPNPSNDKIHVVFENPNEKHSVQITDISGRVVRTYSCNQAELAIEKENLNTGMYLLKVSDTQGQSSLQKIIFY
ncbi:MAG TPA: T9SS type A sorting domain-containing protein [Bacteroidia bacterium]|nr:T9SS type A sorting domain-containing protein [Bacteroidia bacterium]